MRGLEPSAGFRISTESSSNFTTMDSSENEFADYEEDGFPRRMLQTGLLVDKYYTPLLCLFGALGNSLSLVVFCMDAKYRRQSSSYYLCALAVSDSGFLLNLFAVWMESVLGGVITSHLTCPLVMYLGQVTCFMSVYLTVAFTLERYIAINFPFSRPRICTRSKAKKVIAGVATVALLMFSYAWIIAKVIEFPKSVSGSLLECMDREITTPLQANQNDSLGWADGSEEEKELIPTLSDILPDKLFSDINRSEWITNTGNNPKANSGNEAEWNRINQTICGSTTNTRAEEVTTSAGMEYMCTVPERYFEISEIANYIDSAVTLIIPFLLITFFNVRIAISVWKLSGERKHIMASFATTLHTTMIVTTTGADTKNNQQQRLNSVRSSKREKGLGNIVNGPLAVATAASAATTTQEEKAGTEHNVNNGLRLQATGNDNIMPCGNGKRNYSFTQQHKLKAACSGPFQQTQYQHQQQPPSSEVRVTKTLLLVSTVFLVLNLPLHAIRCTQFIQTATGTPEGQEILLALQPWANMLFNTNFAVNFLLYCVGGRNFRKSLRNIAKRILRRRRKPDVAVDFENYSMRRQ